VALCEDHMKRFMGSISGYQQSLQSGRSKSIMRDTWRKLGWTFLKKEETANLTNNLAKHREYIQLMLSVSHR
jgi:hypothetical protein